MNEPRLFEMLDDIRSEQRRHGEAFAEHRGKVEAELSAVKGAIQSLRPLADRVTILEARTQRAGSQPDLTATVDVPSLAEAREKANAARWRAWERAAAVVLAVIGLASGGFAAAQCSSPAPAVTSPGR